MKLHFTVAVPKLPNCCCCFHLCDGFCVNQWKSMGCAFVYYFFLHMPEPSKRRRLVLQSKNASTLIALYIIAKLLDCYCYNFKRFLSYSAANSTFSIAFAVSDFSRNAVVVLFGVCGFTRIALIKIDRRHGIPKNESTDSTKQHIMHDSTYALQTFF